MTIEIEQPDSLSRANGRTLAAAAETPACPARLVPPSLYRFVSAHWMSFGLLALEILILANQLSGGTNPAMGTTD